MLFHNELIDGLVRGRLVSHARGSILELNVGTGANFPHYPSSVSVTGTDLSHRMIAAAKKEAERCGIQAEFVRASVENLNFPPAHFDTVVSTLSLCGYEDPVMVLRRMRDWCKPDGVVLLMEHGLSRYLPVRAAQLALNDLHYRHIGCYLDRDLGQLLVASRLAVTRIDFSPLGITQLIWAAPDPRPLGLSSKRSVPSGPPIL